MKKFFSLLSVIFAVLLCVSAFASCSKKEVVVVKTVESELLAPVPDVTIELVQVDGTVHKDIVKSNVDSYGFYDGEDSQIKEVRNLEKLTEVESIEVQNVRNITDWSFLAKLPKLKSLYLSSVHIEDLQFISTISSLEKIDIDSIYISADSQKQTIDCSKLTNLKSIRFVAIPRITNIPNFVNVTTKPRLMIDNNKITAISKEEAKILQQFSFINVDFTPLTRDYIKRNSWLKNLPFEFIDN